MIDVICYFDGACEPHNPGGNMGIGALVVINNQEVYTYADYIPKSKSNSNNVAEYMGLNNCLDYLINNNLQQKNILVRGDSMLAIMQMKGKWKIKAGAYVKFAQEARQKIMLFSNINFEWIPRELNWRADELSKESILRQNV